MTLWAIILSFLALIGGGAGLYIKGGRAATRKNQVEDLKDEIATRDRMDKAKTGRNPATALDRLRKRKRDRNL